MPELAYGEPQLAALLQSTDWIRYSTTQGTNALVQRAEPQLGLLVTDPTLVEGLGCHHSPGRPAGRHHQLVMKRARALG